MTDAKRVVAERQAGRTVEQALTAVWRSLEERGWLAVATPRIVVQVGQRWRSKLVVETAHSLASRLANHAPGAEVEILDAAAAVNGSRSPASANALEGTLTVSGVAARTLRIPKRWFDPFFLVTVTGAGPDPVTRISALLDAQAEPLHRLDNPVPSASLAYEAHRLFASDLAVVCVTSRREDAATDAWWFVSASDLAAEMAVMRASGCDPVRMPYMKAFARHETLPAFELDGAVPAISGYVAPAWRAEMHAARTRVATTRHAVAEDVLAVRRNLDRIPLAVRRRLANWKRGSG